MSALTGPMDRFERFYTPEPNTGCWLWTGAYGGNEYGKFWMGGAKIFAHRASWILLRGPIMDGLCVLHRCDNPACVNTDHLFLGTQVDNIADMNAKGRGRNQNDLKTGCLRGHPFDAANTRWTITGTRKCRACDRLRSASQRIQRST